MTNRPAKNKGCHHDSPFVFNLKSNTMKKHSANIVITLSKHHSGIAVHQISIT